METIGDWHLETRSADGVVLASVVPEAGGPAVLELGIGTGTLSCRAPMIGAQVDVPLRVLLRVLELGGGYVVVPDRPELGAEGDMRHGQPLEPDVHVRASCDHDGRLRIAVRAISAAVSGGFGARLDDHGSIVDTIEHAVRCAYRAGVADARPKGGSLTVDTGDPHSCVIAGAERLGRGEVRDVVTKLERWLGAPVAPASRGHKPPGLDELEALRVRLVSYKDPDLVGGREHLVQLASDGLTAIKRAAAANDDPVLPLLVDGIRIECEAISYDHASKADDPSGVALRIHGGARGVRIVRYVREGANAADAPSGVWPFGNGSAVAREASGDLAIAVLESRGLASVLVPRADVTSFGRAVASATNDGRVAELEGILEALYDGNRTDAQCTPAQIEATRRVIAAMETSFGIRLDRSPNGDEVALREAIATLPVAMWKPDGASADWAGDCAHRVRQHLTEAGYLVVRRAQGPWTAAAARPPLTVLQVTAADVARRPGDRRTAVGEVLSPSAIAERLIANGADRETLTTFLHYEVQHQAQRGVLPLYLDDGTVWTCDGISGGADSTDGEPNGLTIRITQPSRPDQDRVIRYVRAVPGRIPLGAYAIPPRDQRPTLHAALNLRASALRLLALWTLDVRARPAPLVERLEAQIVAERDSLRAAVAPAPGEIEAAAAALAGAIGLQPPPGSAA